MKQPTEDGFSLAWHSLLPWLESVAPLPKTARALLGRLMRDYGRDAVILAFDRTLEASPRPADPFTYFTKLVSSNVRTLGDAQSAWNTVVRLAANSATAASLASPRINMAVSAIGGWPKVGYADKKSMGALRGQFVQVFAEQNETTTPTH